MKEATGEASNTVITVILIAAILAAAALLVNFLAKQVQDRANESGSAESAQQTADTVSNGLK